MNQRLPFRPSLRLPRRFPRPDRVLAVVLAALVALGSGSAASGGSAAGAASGASASSGVPGPAGLEAEAGSASVRLSWEAPPSPAAPVVAYSVYRNPSGDASPVVTVPVQVESYTDYGVVSGATYAYTVTARLADGTETQPAGPVSASPQPDGVAVVLVLGWSTAVVNGETTALDAPAEIVKGSTMVPLRFVGTALGAGVAYDGADKRVTVTLGSRTVNLWVGQTRAEIDQRRVTISAAPVLLHGHTLVPVRFIAEAFGADVGFDARTGRITVALEDSDSSPGAASALVVGPAASSSLSGPADVDFFRCPVTAGRTYRVAASGLPAGGGVALAIVDPNLDPGRAVTRSVSGWPLGGDAAELELAAGPAQSEIYVRVQAVDPSGPEGEGRPAASGGAYTLAVTDVTEPADTPAGAPAMGALAGGFAASGTLHAASDADYLSFQAETGRTYAISADPAAEGSAPAAGAGASPASRRPLELALTVCDQAGLPLLWGDTQAQDDAPAVVWTCPAAGRYYVSVGSLLGDAGAYQLLVEPWDGGGNDDLRTATVLGPDRDGRAGFLTSPSDRDWFGFPVTRGRLYYIQTNSGSGSGAAAITLRSWDGTGLGSGQTAPGLGFPGTGQLVVWTATYDGLVYAEVSPGQPGSWGPGNTATGLGRYTISATTTGPEDDDYPYLATPLEAGGSPVYGSLPDGDRDWYSISVTRGVTYSLGTLDLSRGCDTDLAVFDRDWNLVAANDDLDTGYPASRAIWTSDESGTLYVCVTPVYLDDYNDGTGTYAIVFGLPGAAPQS